MHEVHVPIVLKSGSLNILEPLGLVQVCNGLALPLPLPFPLLLICMKTLLSLLITSG